MTSHWSNQLLIHIHKKVMKHISNILTPGYSDPELENNIRKKDTTLKELARKNAIHFAKSNRPLPKGDKLEPYIGDIKSGYEELASYIHQYLQPITHLPELKMNAEWAKGKKKQLEAEIEKLEGQNHNDEYALGNYASGNVTARIRTAVIITALIGMGEVVFNTQVFQVTGGNMLFALILAVAVSVAVFILTHITPLLYKNTEGRTKKTLIISSALVLATTLFSAMAILRSVFLQQLNVVVAPVYFVVINVFFFIVASLLSYYIFPTLDELKKYFAMAKLIKEISKRSNKITELKKELDVLRTDILKSTKTHIRAAYYAKYLVERSKKMYREGIETFKSTNLSFRTDNQTPDCFYDDLPQADISHDTVKSISSNSKIS